MEVGEFSGCWAHLAAGKTPPLCGACFFTHDRSVDFTNEHISAFRAALEKDYQRRFTKDEALDALTRLDRFVRVVTGELKSVKQPSKLDDQAASA